jgi:hypothetical protein
MHGDGLLTDTPDASQGLCHCLAKRDVILPHVILPQTSQEPLDGTRLWIGKIKALFVPPAGAAPPPGRAWYGTVCTGAGRRGGALGGGRRDGTRACNTKKCERPLRRTHGAHETTRAGAGLGHPVERCLARTGRRDGGWVYRQFQVVEDLAEGVSDLLILIRGVAQTHSD